MNSPYLDEILRGSRRLLTLMNRNELGDYKGLFSRNFWHFKTSDIPSASDQMGLGILAKLWHLEGTEYYHSPQVLHWACLAIEGLATIQKNDGSFDEWYFNERGWAGPTGYVMNSALDSYELLKDSLPKVHLDLLEGSIRKGIKFLALSQEGHVLANHIAMAILPMIQAVHLLQMQELRTTIDHLIADFEKVWNNEEGWSLEYDGADPGYQSATLSFFSKALKYEHNSRLEEICLKSLDFISHFAMPSGSVGGAIGSRHTVTFFCAGIEAFRDTPQGARLSNFIREGFKNDTIVLSGDLDDHYMIYRLYELLDAHFFYNRKKAHSLPAILPWENTTYRKSYKSAGIELGVTGNAFWIIALKRGGVVRIENISDRMVLLSDAGVFVSSGKKLFSSLWQGDFQVSISNESFEVSGELVDVTPKVFSPVKMVAFRMFCIVTGFHRLPAFWLKNFIRRLLIVSNKKTQHRFKRKIHINNSSLEVITEVCPGEMVDRLNVGGEFWSRYVPQSRHYLKEHLTNFTPYQKLSNVAQTVDSRIKVNF